MAIAGSIIFHHFALWAGFQEHSREGYKFETEGDYKQVEKKSVINYVSYNEDGSLNMESSNQEDRIREERKAKKESNSE